MVSYHLFKSPVTSTPNILLQFTQDSKLLCPRQASERLDSEIHDNHHETVLGNSLESYCTWLFWRDWELTSERLIMSDLKPSSSVTTLQVALANLEWGGMFCRSWLWYLISMTQPFPLWVCQWMGCPPYIQHCSCSCAHKWNCKTLLMCAVMRPCHYISPTSRPILVNWLTTATEVTFSYISGS